MPEKKLCEREYDCKLKAMLNSTFSDVGNFCRLYGTNREQKDRILECWYSVALRKCGLPEDAGIVQ